MDKEGLKRKFSCLYRKIGSGGGISNFKTWFGFKNIATRSNLALSEMFCERGYFTTMFTVFKLSRFLPEKAMKVKSEATEKGLYDILVDFLNATKSVEGLFCKKNFNFFTVDNELNNQQLINKSYLR